jgi:hypothetical protein
MKGAIWQRFFCLGRCTDQEKKDVTVAVRRDCRIAASRAA